MRTIKNEKVTKKSGSIKSGVILAACLATMCATPNVVAAQEKEPGLTSESFSLNTKGFITTSLSDVTKSAAIELVASHFNLQPLIHVPLEGFVSLQLERASFDRAMKQILGETKASYMVENGKVHVFLARETWNKIEAEKQATSTNEPEQKAVVPVKEEEPVISRIVQLSKRSSADIQKLIKDLDSKLSCVFDAPTNSLIIKGVASQVKEAVKLCDEIDNMVVTQATKKAALERSLFVTNTYNLEHADFEEIEKELENIIERNDGSSSSSSSSTTAKVDKDGNPIETEYFLLDKARRTLIVHTTEQKMRVIDRYFKAIDHPLPQVLIEAQIVSVKDGVNKTLGIDWSALGSYNGPEVPWSTSKNGPAATTVPFQYGKWNLTQLSATLEASKNKGDVKILSRPRILAVSGKEASIHVGDELPYVTSQTDSTGGSTTQNVEYKQVGVKLDVTPTINLKKGTIFMKLTPEVSEELDPVMINGNRVPVITTRKAESTIEIKDGETMVIGGLLKDEDNVTETKVPGLSKLPGIGRLFTSKNHKKEKTNLMILLTPRIITDSYKAEVTKEAVSKFNNKSNSITSQLEKPIVDVPSIIEVPAKPVVETELSTQQETPIIVSDTQAKAPVVEQYPQIPVRKEKLKTKEYLQKRLEQIRSTTRKND